jgi:hypothetical protein
VCVHWDAAEGGPRSLGDLQDNGRLLRARRLYELEDNRLSAAGRRWRGEFHSSATSMS